ncbi:MAG: hypothetical protein GY874_10650 [Desulfobacteraceae bacterium]|nr:hypothetical protein [Desulfobacteraceae bacterium]
MMVKNKLNFKTAYGFALKLAVCLSFSLFTVPINGFCEEVSLNTARQVAESKIAQHISLYGDWNGFDSPVISSWETVMRNDVPVAYNFSVEPSGHLLIAADDALSPVLLYSSSCAFYPERSDQYDTIEAWVVPELHRNVKRLTVDRQQYPDTWRSLVYNDSSNKIAQAWDKYANENFSHEPMQRTLVRTATAGPLLSTAWGQGSPYNLMSPNNDCFRGYTLTGCVPTAWAQVLRYWSWPAQGQGSHSYTWNSETLSANFGATAYDWNNMPEVLTTLSLEEQKDAVSLLMYHLGVASETAFGCYSSGSEKWADEILYQYFKYKSSMQFKVRNEFIESSQWFALFQTELDADPPRPVVLSIFGVYGGHEVIVDGYQSGTTDAVHINYGWDGNYDGYYTITSNFDAGGYTWDASIQAGVFGIEPDNNPPAVDAGANQSVKQLSPIQLTGSASDPEAIGIDSYQWTQISGTRVNLSGATTLTPAFTAPEVDSDTDLVFQLRADDKNRAFAVDTCTVTVIKADCGDADI